MRSQNCAHRPAVIGLALGKGWRSAAASKCHSIAPASNSMAPPNTRS